MVAKPDIAVNLPSGVGVAFPIFLFVPRHFIRLNSYGANSFACWLGDGTAACAYYIGLAYTWRPKC